MESTWNEQQLLRWRNEAYWRGEKDELAGALLAFFLGAFGAHHFYLRRYGLGIGYLLFFWTGIPALLGLVECVFMPARVRAYNWQLRWYLNVAPCPPAYSASYAAYGAAPVRMLPPPRCGHCGAALAPQATSFCCSCGAALAG